MEQGGLLLPISFVNLEAQFYLLHQQFCEVYIDIVTYPSLT